jgi:predicted AAA+ superfamily ATPase
MYKRKLTLPETPKNSFFLWGPRQIGKSTLLKNIYPNVKTINLLRPELFRRLSQNPELLREMVFDDEFVIIDEIQKIPALLDEVHYLIESEKKVFALCGSSARKLKRGHANLLGGRARRYELFGLKMSELGEAFSIEKILNRGYIPNHYLAEDYRFALRSYVSDYLKEEIAAEGLVRNLQSFSEFLDVASLSDTSSVNFTAISRDCGISAYTAKSYFSILEDTLIGSWLKAYRKKPKRRISASPKFYFFDVGLVNVLAKRGTLTLGSELFGKAFENWVYHELRSLLEYSKSEKDLSYWSLTSGAEVDFIIGDLEVAIEAKAVSKVNSHHLKNLRELKKEHSQVRHLILLCFESEKRKTQDGIIILPYKDLEKEILTLMKI